MKQKRKKKSKSKRKKKLNWHRFYYKFINWVSLISNNIRKSLVDEKLQQQNSQSPRFSILNFFLIFMTHSLHRGYQREGLTGKPAAKPVKVGVRLKVRTTWSGWEEEEAEEGRRWQEQNVRTAEGNERNRGSTTHFTVAVEHCCVIVGACVWSVCLTQSS